MISGIARDVSESKRVEEALQQQIERERMIAVMTQQIHQSLNIELAERKHTEEKLRKSEARLAEAQRLAHIGNWV